jgi:hypothetical protein
MDQKHDIHCLKRGDREIQQQLDMLIGEEPNNQPLLGAKRKKNSFFVRTRVLRLMMSSDETLGYGREGKGR